MQTMNCGEVLVVLFGFVPDAYFGKTFLRHLATTNGRGRYKAIWPRSRKPLQFVYIDEQGNDTGKFVGVAIHKNGRKVSFGAKHDNR